MRYKSLQWIEKLSVISLIYSTRKTKSSAGTCRFHYSPHQPVSIRYSLAQITAITFRLYYGEL